MRKRLASLLIAIAAIAGTAGIAAASIANPPNKGDATITTANVYPPLGLTVSLNVTEDAPTGYTLVCTFDGKNVGEWANSTANTTGYFTLVGNDYVAETVKYAVFEVSDQSTKCSSLVGTVIPDSAWLNVNWTASPVWGPGISGQTIGTTSTTVPCKHRHHHRRYYS